MSGTIYSCKIQGLTRPAQSLRCYFWKGSSVELAGHIAICFRISSFVKLNFMQSSLAKLLEAWIGLQCMLNFQEVSIRTVLNWKYYSISRLIKIVKFWITKIFCKIYFSQGYERKFIVLMHVRELLLWLMINRSSSSSVLCHRGKLA